MWTADSKYYIGNMKKVREHLLDCVSLFVSAPLVIDINEVLEVLIEFIVYGLGTR